MTPSVSERPVEMTTPSGVKFNAAPKRERTVVVGYLLELETVLLVDKFLNGVGRAAEVAVLNAICLPNGVRGHALILSSLPSRARRSIHCTDGSLPVRRTCQ